MPIPIIAWGIGAGVLALGGLIKGGKAISDNKQAKNIQEDAERVLRKAKRRINTARTKTGTAFETYGKIKYKALTVNLSNFVDEYSKLNNVDFKDSQGLKELGKLKLDTFNQESLTKIREMSKTAMSVIGGAAGGTAGGILTAFGAYSAVGALAAAGTGTAISTLSGIAAVNATLAWLGGGTLAAGGLGIAGGMAVLGGLVAGPALLIMGFTMGAGASKNLDNAKSNFAKAKEIAEELDAGVDLCTGIRKIVNVYIDALTTLDEMFTERIESLKNVIKNSGTDYLAYTEQEQKVVVYATALAGSIKSILDVPILQNNGKLTQKSKDFAKEIPAILKAAENIS